MHKSKLIITILISVVALVFFEGLIKTYITTAYATPTSSPFTLKNFIPSIITALIVGIPLALQYKPNSFHIFIPTGVIWLVIAVLGTNLLTTFGGEYYFLALVHLLGPKISAISLLLIIAYIVDNDLINKNET